MEQLWKYHFLLSKFLNFPNIWLEFFINFWILQILDLPVSSWKVSWLSPNLVNQKITIPNPEISLLLYFIVYSLPCYINTEITSKWWQYVSRRLFCRAWKSSLMAISSMAPMIWSNSVLSVSSMNTSSSSTKPAEKTKLFTFFFNILTNLAQLEYCDLERIWEDSWYLRSLGVEGNKTTTIMFYIIP